MIRARILSTGKYLPERILTNTDLEKLCDTNDEWIRKRTGIEQRHIVAEGQAASDLAYEASKQAIERAGIKAEEIDLVLFATLTPDHQLPASANILQHRIGATHAGGMDLNAACSGFLYGLSTADAFIRSGIAKTILIVGAEVSTTAITWEARDTAVLFGDGAGAVIVRAEEGERGVLSNYLRSDGGGADVLIMPGGGSRIPFRGGTFDPNDRILKMNGKELFRRAVMGMGEAALKALEQTGLSVDDISLMIPHQANGRIIQAAAERVNLPMEKVVINIDKVGNTIAASIPIALDEAVCAGRVKANDLIMFVGFGAGLTWGSAIVRW